MNMQQGDAAQFPPQPCSTPNFTRSKNKQGSPAESSKQNQIFSHLRFCVLSPKAKSVMKDDPCCCSPEESRATVLDLDLWPGGQRQASSYNSAAINHASIIKMDRLFLPILHVDYLNIHQVILTDERRWWLSSSWYQELLCTPPRTWGRKGGEKPSRGGGCLQIVTYQWSG